MGAVLFTLIVLYGVTMYKSIGKGEYFGFSQQTAIHVSLNKHVAWQRDILNLRIENRDFPPLGIFPPGASVDAVWRGNQVLEDNIWKESPNSMMYQAVISLDYSSGKLYAVYTDIYFLKEKFPQKFKPLIIKYIDELNAYMEEKYGSVYLLQNTDGDPYTSGDTVLTLVNIISSDDILSFYKNTN